MAVTWKDIYKSNFLTNQDVYDLNNNFLWLQTELNALSIPCTGVTKIDYIDELINIPDVFNHIEDDMEAIYKSLLDYGVSVQSFGSKYLWSYSQRDIINKIWRWYDFMWTVKNLISSGISDTGLLYCSDSDGNPVQVYDINGKAIYVEVIIND